MQQTSRIFKKTRANTDPLQGEEPKAAKATKVARWRSGDPNVDPAWLDKDVRRPIKCPPREDESDEDYATRLRQAQDRMKDFHAGRDGHPAGCLRLQGRDPAPACDAALFALKSGIRSIAFVKQRVHKVVNAARRIQKWILYCIGVKYDRCMDQVRKWDKHYAKLERDMKAKVRQLKEGLARWAAPPEMKLRAVGEVWWECFRGLRDRMR
eukprot:gene21815-11_t